MIVYHASYRKFNQPNLKFAKSYRDFGQGFYVTEYYLDALSILKGNQGYIYKYELNDDDLTHLEISDDNILNEIIKFRSQNIDLNYDIISGPTATGKITKLFKQIRNGEDCINAIKKEIKFDTYHNQICLKSNKAINQLTLLEIEDIYE